MKTLLKKFYNAGVNEIADAMKANEWPARLCCIEAGVWRNGGRKRRKPLDGSRSLARAGRERN